MNDGTRFWIVRPRVGAAGVSGLGTLHSGAFVEVDPGTGEATTAFQGLEEPPPIRSDVAGRQYELHADRLGSVSRGSPVYYRSVQVGQVLGYELADDKKNLVVDAFVATPHDQLVRDNSQFWNTSGINISSGAEGVNVAVEALQALLAGGIAFDTPAIGRPGEPAAQVEVEVTRFEVETSGNAVLDARWLVLGERGEAVLRNGRSTIVQPTTTVTTPPPRRP